MDTELIHWGWLAVFLVLMLACWTTGISAYWYTKGQERGRVEGYSFAKDPAHEEFHGVPYSLTRVIDTDDYETWRNSLGKEDLL